MVSFSSFFLLRFFCSEFFFLFSKYYVSYLEVMYSLFGFVVHQLIPLSFFLSSCSSFVSFSSFILSFWFFALYPESLNGRLCFRSWGGVFVVDFVDLYQLIFLPFLSSLFFLLFPHTQKVPQRNYYVSGLEVVYSLFDFVGLYQLIHVDIFFQVNLIFQHNLKYRFLEMLKRKNSEIENRTKDIKRERKAKKKKRRTEEGENEKYPKFVLILNSIIQQHF